MKKLTSRERIRKTLSREQVDRIPIDIGGTEVTGIHADEYIEIARYLGIDVMPPKIYDQGVMLPRFDELMRRRFFSDVIMLENPYCTMGYSLGFRNHNWKIWKTALGNDVLMPGDFNPIEDEKGYIYLKSSSGKTVAYKAKSGLYFEKYCEDYVSNDELMTPEEWKNKIPLYTDEELTHLSRTAEYLYKYTDYSLFGNCQRGKLGSTGTFAGQNYTDWLCTLLVDQDYAFSILEATAERAIENMKLYLQATGQYIDSMLVSTFDYGTQKCELFSPQVFEKLYKPNIKRINRFIHDNSDVKIMYHSCGSIRNIIGHMIEAEVDILNPIQTSAGNMDPTELKEEFGDKIIFWGGGADTQGVLQFGTVEEVINHVKERVRIFNRGGGFVFSAVHNIQYGVPPENVIAMIDTVMALA